MKDMNDPKRRYSRQFSSNIPRYFLYTALKGFGFGLITAIWVIYLQRQRGLTLTQAKFDVAPQFCLCLSYAVMPMLQAK